MTHGALRVSAIALGAAVFVSPSPLYTACADASTPSGTASTPSGEPAHPYVRHYAHYYTHHTHYVRQNGHRNVYVYYPHANTYYPYANTYYPTYGYNPVAAAAAGVIGGIAALSAIVVYPIICFPYYGSCPVYPYYAPY